MAGLYLNKEKVTKSIYDWLYRVLDHENSWEGNNLHIDEILSFENIDRSDWIKFSFLFLKVILDEVKIPDSYLVFLHIVLSEAKIKEVKKNISYSWLEKNLNEFTPPSFNCTTKEYYNQFYKHELQECFLDKSFSDSIELKGINCFHRSHFDSSEKLFSRELYVFDGSVI